MNINIFGSDGMIGRDLQNYGSDIFHFFSSKNNINYFTLSDIKNSKIEHLYENDLVLFLSAISKPGECELHKNQCLEVNYFKTSDTIERLLSNGVKIIFASTDQVYGSSNDKIFHEKSQVNPQNFYAYSKLLIEEKFSNYENFKALRFSQCINGLDSFSEYCKSCMKYNKSIEIFSNFTRNIFSTDLLYDFLNFLFKGELLFKNLPKILNFGGSNHVNRIEFSYYLNDFQLIKKDSTKIFLPKININVDELEKILGRQYNFNFSKWKKHIYEKK